jgi:hypothetical protein
MKKRILLFTSSIALLAGMVLGNAAGPAEMSNTNRSGSDGVGPANCSSGGCHNGGSFNTSNLSITLNQGLNQPGTWTPGQTYTVILGGNSDATKYGFQLGVSYYNGTDTLMAGTLNAVNGTNTQKWTLNGFELIEHTQALNVVNQVLGTTATWTAPAVTTIDTITFYFTVNAVNGNGAVNGDNSITFARKFGRNTTSVAELNADIKIDAYPNPVTDRLNLNLENAGNGTYTINVIDIVGRTVATETATVNKSHKTSIDATSWTSGMYYVQLKKDGAQKTIAVMKQ